MAAEKTEKALIEGIAKFDQAKLKHTETQEKNPLPDKEGTFAFNIVWYKCVNCTLCKLL